MGLPRQLGHRGRKHHLACARGSRRQPALPASGSPARRDLLCLDEVGYFTLAESPARKQQHPVRGQLVDQGRVVT